MSSGPDPYFRHRERQERARAERCADPAIRAIHLDLAARYAAITEDGDAPAGDAQPGVMIPAG